MEASTKDPGLIQLREDLRLLPGAPNASGSPSWLIYDPVQHRYFQIDQRTRGLLEIWPKAPTMQQFIALARQAFEAGIDDKEIEGLISFAEQNSWTIEPRSGGGGALWSRKNQGRHGLLMGAVHHYLFFRVPLFRPDRFLRATLPLVMPLCSRFAGAVILLSGIAGLYLASRQWDVFMHTAASFLSFDGAMYFGAGLVFVKALHELGHAYTAVRFGCAVPSMGVAFMVMAPMLYTDVTDAWRLTSRRQKILVACAGIFVELALACIASLAWALLPDGHLRSVAFVIATTGWILSLMMNLNPLMRFDGYYIMSDALGLENMLDRSFALGRWKLREILFDLRAPPPEYIEGRRQLMIGYAWAVWVYRLVLFTGIALLVYHYFFKALGIVLFLVEIVYFIMQPIWREVRAWVSQRQTICLRPRAALTALCAGGGLVLVFVPWSSRVEVPAVLELGQQARIYSIRPAEVVSVKVAWGEHVSKGATLVELVSHDVENEIKLSQIKLSAVELRRARLASDKADREQTLVLEGEQRSLKSKIEGLVEEQRALVLRAPIDGEVLELEPSLVPGRWIHRKDAVALVGDRSKLEAKGYVTELEAARISIGTTGLFIADDATEENVSVTVADIAKSGARSIEIAALASPHGGPIEVRSERQRGLVPLSAYYFVRMQAQPRLAPISRSLRGIVVLDGQRESIAVSLWRRAAGILVRESGF